MRSHIQIHHSVKHQLLVISISMLFFPLTCVAATFTVTNTNDSGPGSLRQAIASSNDNQQADTIIFDPVIFSSPQVIFLTTGELQVLRDMQPVSGTAFNISIIGPGPQLLTIDANHNSRIFFSQEGNYTFFLSGVTLTHGFATNGGAIHSRNNPNFSNIVVTENLVEGGDLGPPGQFYAGRGGGIFAEGGLLIRDSTFSNNIARGILLPGNQNVGDYGSAGAGGAIATGNSIYVIHCNFIHNMAQGVTSGISSRVESRDGRYCVRRCNLRCK